LKAQCTSFCAIQHRAGCGLREVPISIPLFPIYSPSFESALREPLWKSSDIRNSSRLQRAHRNALRYPVLWVFRAHEVTPMKLRLDKLLVDRSLAASRERAQAMIIAGRVLVDEQRIDKSGASVSDTAAIRLLGDDLRYVSRGGLKLEAALNTWDLSVEGLACADIGASTGGFTDCMLQAGAQSVLAVDTGYGQIHNKLRNDPRVTLLERTNARLLTPGQLCPSPLASRISFFAMDVSFISATLVLPAVISALAPPETKWQGEAVLLVKPQFEAGREHVGKGGIVRDPAAHQLAVHRVEDAVRACNGEALALIDSPILGMEGNREFLLHARFSQSLSS